MGHPATVEQSGMHNGVWDQLYIKQTLGSCCPFQTDRSSVRSSLVRRLKSQSSCIHGVLFLRSRLLT